MAVTLTTLKTLNEEVVASASDGAGTIYLATNKGNVYQYSVSGATLTLLSTVDGKIESMALYSTVLYLGIAGGRIASLTTS